MGTKAVATAPFGGAEMFGPDGISTLIFGTHGYYNEDDDGYMALTLGLDSSHMYGDIDDITLWDRSLTASEVAWLSLNHASLTGLEDGLALYYPLKMLAYAF